MTMSISFLVSGKGAQAGIALRGTPAQTRAQGGNEYHLEVARRRDPGDRRQHERGKADEHRDAESRAASTHRPADELCGADRAEDAADAAAERFVPLAECVPDRDSDAGCKDERTRQRDARPGE